MSAIPGDMTDSDLRKIVLKSEDDRLRKELKVGQTVIDSLTIDQMTRDDLVIQVTLLRRAAGFTTAVQSIVTGFKPAPFTPATGLAASPSVTPPDPLPSSDPMSAMLSMLMQQQQQQALQQQQMQQQMQQQLKEERERADKREELREKKETEERELRDKREELREKKEKEEKDLKEKKETEEKDLKEKKETEERELRDKREKEEREIRDKKEVKDRKKLEKKEAKDRKERETMAEAKRLERAADREIEAEKQRIEGERVRLSLLEAQRQLEIDRDVATQANVLAQQNITAATKRHEEVMNHSIRTEARIVEDSKKPEARLKRLNNIMRGILFKMPDNSEELPMYFEAIDRIFETYHVDSDLKIPILTPFLTATSRRLLGTLPAEDVATYEAWSKSLLREHHLTPRNYLKNYLNCERNINESCIQFSTRLTCLLKYYLDSRQINSSYERLVSLLLADRLKSSLKDSTRYHISDRETPDWKSATEISLLVDRFEAERKDSYVYSPSTNSLGGSQTSNSFGSKSNLFNNSGARPKTFVKQPYIPRNGAWRDRVRCENCGGAHFTSVCFKRRQVNNVSNVGVSKQMPSKRLCFTCGSDSHIAKFCNKNKNPHQVNAAFFRRPNNGKFGWDKGDTNVKQIYRVHTEDTFSECSTYTADNLLTAQQKFDDNYVWVDFGSGPVKSIIDSGASITIVKPEMVGWENSEGAVPMYITLQSAFGDQVKGLLSNLSVCLTGREGTSQDVPRIQLTCAVTEKLAQDVALVTPSDFDALRRSRQQYIPSVRMIKGTDIMYDDPRVTHDKESVRLEILAVNQIDKIAIAKGEKIQDKSNVVNEPSTSLQRALDVEQYRIAQLNDVTLASCWEDASEQSLPFYINPVNKLLFRKHLIGGFEIDQLVLPLEKREKVIRLSHDSDWSMHYGIGKTVQRVQAYFYWPSLRADIESFVRSCSACQMHARKTKLDRVPISPIIRSDVAFDQVFVDLIGPLDPPSSKNHKYILCLVDSCTRWCEAVPLKTLTAIETADALISIFTRIGIPRVIVSDNATNFVSALSDELYERLGIEVRHASPRHPQANGTCERWNQTLKYMLHHVANSDKPREWDKKLPYLLWSYRELPCSTTGLSPYQMVYGRSASGPLSVLKNTWSNDVTAPPILNKTAVEYLEKLREHLAIGVESAKTQSEKAQLKYTNNHNLISKDKSFELGDLVLALFPDSTNKLAAQWQGPGCVTAILTPYSYRVAMNNGSIRTFHANDLRKFVTRVQTIGVIFEDDVDFGKIEYCPMVGEGPLPAINSLDLSHLSDVRQSQLRALLYKHRDVFSDKPGHCHVTAHKIDLEPDFKPKAMYPYRIPDKLKVEVDRQIEQLLKDGKIRHSTSPYAHPVVCIAKPNNEIRLCTDLRHVNSGTIADAYPMPRADDLLLKMSNSFFLTKLDAVSGFWQIPMRPSDVHKTAFVTNSGHYEWLVMPFGLKTASNTFQRVMNDILRPHAAYAHAYIDDTSVHSKTWSEHLDHLDKVLSDIQGVGMTLRLSKCSFALGKVDFIGFRVGSGERTVIQSKVDAIKVVPEPHNKKLLRSFLGMCAFYRNFIPNFSEIALPLTEMTKNKQSTNFKFNDSQRAAFLLLKDNLCRTAILYSPLPNKPFIVRTDASDVAIGATVSQKDEQDVERPVAFASAKLTEVQRRWSTIEREAYAVIFALQKFDVLLYGSLILLYSDHDPLRYLALSMPKSAKLTRWSLSLTRYNIIVQHIKGTDNVVADCLSRCVT